MQGKQNVSNLERKGPHKSMHCKFCKPPGVITPEKSTRPQMETKTKIHLVHEGADLRVCNIHDEPGLPAPPETDACICILEGENPCPKCVPDKNREPVKKKTCRCPKGAKPHPNMFDTVVPKKKKEKDEDNEFWWEKYSKEHDAAAKETWAAYMAQRRKEKKIIKCQKREKKKLMKQNTKGLPKWYQKLSCQQVMYIEFLSTAIRLDSDENITDRTYFVLSGIGLYPRPKRKILKKCLRYCHYNSIQFLNQLHLLTRDDDPFDEKFLPPSLKNSVLLYSWNERLIMNSMCHLEFPALLRELMDRLPPLPRDKTLPQIPYPVFPKPPKKTYKNPYEEPIWREQLNWVDKMKIDRMNRWRAHMDTKRVKIPPLALVRRPSLIDARPPFLNQIEANERASRRPLEQKERKRGRKHPITTFNSAVDVTAIAGIEASEISTTDKADTEEICVFLREPLKEPESMEEEEFLPEKEITFMLDDPEAVTTQVDCLNPFSDVEEYSAEEDKVEDIPFKTPPKTESGATIQSVCPPPQATPGPPAVHYEVARRELDIINNEICGFQPFVSSSTQTLGAEPCDTQDDVMLQLESAADRLKELAKVHEEKELNRPKKKKKKKCNTRGKCKRERKIKKERVLRKRRKSEKTEKPRSGLTEMQNHSKGRHDVELGHTEEEKEEAEQEGNSQDPAMDLGYQRRIEKERWSKFRRRDSIISDPDPDPDDDQWPAGPPCISDVEKIEEKKKKNGRKGQKGKKRRTGRGKIAKHVNKTRKKKRYGMELMEEREEYLKKRVTAMKTDKETMTECYRGEYDHLYAQVEEKKKKEEEKKMKAEPKEVNLFTGDLSPVLLGILTDLADEGYISAAYEDIQMHPDIDRLIMYLRGEMVTKERKELLHSITKMRWAKMKGILKFSPPDLGISPKKTIKATWNDKRWISRLAKIKTDEFYFKVANSRAMYGIDLYNTLYQNHFGSDRFLNIYYAYMTSKFEDAILRGIW